MEALSSSLPPRLLRSLQKLARTYREEGLELFMFGSFARGDQRPTSDLELGVEWVGKRNSKVFTRLYWEVQDLPTIRKIELVDFSQVDPEFKRVATADKITLATLKDLQNEERIA